MTKTYSQIGQDIVAYEFFKSYPPKGKTFVEVGAFDGISFSNTRLFFENGWNGISIEPILKNYTKLEKLYQNTNVLTVRAAAADFIGESVFNVATIPGAEDWGSDVSAPGDDAMEKWPDYLWNKELVPVKTLNSILEENNIERIDFVSIDVEGNELAVLRGFDLAKYTPRLIISEYSSHIQRKELKHYLLINGYFIWDDNKQDLFAVRGSITDYLPDLPRILWKRFKANISRFKASIFRRFSTYFKNISAS
jgi:FkbM family methyltransferase